MGFPARSSIALSVSSLIRDQTRPSSFSTPKVRPSKQSDSRTASVTRAGLPRKRRQSTGIRGKLNLKSYVNASDLMTAPTTA